MPKNPNKATNQAFKNGFILFNKFDKNTLNYPSPRQFNKCIPNIKHDLFPHNNNVDVIAETEVRNEAFAACNGRPNSERFYDKVSKDLRSWNSNNFYRLFGGKKDPFYYPVREGFNKLITIEMYCVLIGLIISDAHITPSGVMEIDQTNRKKSNSVFMELLIEILAPIIDSIDIHSTALTDKTTREVEDYDFDSNLVLDPATQNIIAPDLWNYSYPDNSLDGDALGVKLDTLITKVANQPLFNVAAGEAQPPVGKASFNTRIRTLPIFKSWHSIFYQKSADGKKWVKQIPFNFADVFTNPMMLAFAIMGDGGGDSSTKESTSGATIINDGRLRFYIGGLDAEALQEIIENNFNLITTIDRTSKNSVRLLFQMDAVKNGQNKVNMSLCYKLIAPYLIGAMQYKIIDPSGPKVIRKAKPLSQTNQDLLIKSKQYLIQDKFNYSRINQKTEFVGHLEDVLIFRNSHNIALKNGDYRMSIQTEIYLRQYVAYVVAIKKYLGALV